MSGRKVLEIVSSQGQAEIDRKIQLWFQRMRGCEHCAECQQQIGKLMAMRIPDAGVIFRGQRLK